MRISSNRPAQDRVEVDSCGEGFACGDQVAAAILDRLLHHNQVPTDRGDSHRLREQRRSGLFRPRAGAPLVRHRQRSATDPCPGGLKGNRHNSRRTQRKPANTTDQGTHEQHQAVPPPPGLNDSDDRAPSGQDDRSCGRTTAGKLGLSLEESGLVCWGSLDHHSRLTGGPGHLRRELQRPAAMVEGDRRTGTADPPGSALGVQFRPRRSRSDEQGKAIDGVAKAALTVVCGDCCNGRKPALRYTSSEARCYGDADDRRQSPRLSWCQTRGDRQGGCVLQTGAEFTAFRSGGKARSPCSGSYPGGWPFDSG